jgi:cytochrome P450
MVSSTQSELFGVLGAVFLPLHGYTNIPPRNTDTSLFFVIHSLYEALRIYPVLPRNLRMCVKDDVLPDGTKVYVGEWVTWSSYVMGRSERIWGPDAKSYNPGRWINTEKPSQGKFNSFHAGPRVCPGQQFATIEALSMIGMILQRFEVSLVDPHSEPQYRASLNLPMADGLKIRVKRRSN